MRQDWSFVNVKEMSDEKILETIANAWLDLKIDNNHTYRDIYNDAPILEIIKNVSLEIDRIVDVDATPMFRHKQFRDGSLNVLGWLFAYRKSLITMVDRIPTGNPGSVGVYELVSRIEDQGNVAFYPGRSKDVMVLIMILTRITIIISISFLISL